MPGASFTICYHAHGTNEWNLDWSHRLTQDDAMQEMIDFVKSSMLLIG